MSMSSLGNQSGLMGRARRSRSASCAYIAWLNTTKDINTTDKDIRRRLIHPNIRSPVVCCFVQSSPCAALHSVG
jgi:hypothetical protein